MMPLLVSIPPIAEPTIPDFPLDGICPRLHLTALNQGVARCRACPERSWAPCSGRPTWGNLDAFHRFSRKPSECRMICARLLAHFCLTHAGERQMRSLALAAGTGCHRSQRGNH